MNNRSIIISNTSEEGSTMAILPNNPGGGGGGESNAINSEQTLQNIMLQMTGKQLKAALNQAKVVQMKAETEAMGVDPKYLDQNASNMASFHKTLTCFMAKIKAQKTKYKVGSPNYNEEMLQNAFICQKFMDLIKTRFTMIIDNGHLANADSIYALCEDIPVMEKMMNNLLKTLE